jgi:serine protease inhibitor
MHNRFLYLLLPGLFAFMPATTENTFHDRPHPAFVLSHNQFAFHLLDAIVTEDNSGTNKLVSPLSLYLTLGMLCNGAAHDTISIANAIWYNRHKLSLLPGYEQLMKNRPYAVYRRNDPRQRRLFQRRLAPSL